MTLDRYGHLYPDDLDGLAAALGARSTAAAAAPRVAQGGHITPESLTE